MMRARSPVLLFKLWGTLLCSLFGAPIADQGVKRWGWYIPRKYEAEGASTD
jgi:hypothetical protein